MAASQKRGHNTAITCPMPTLFLIFPLEAVRCVGAWVEVSLRASFMAFFLLGVQGGMNDGSLMMMTTTTTMMMMMMMMMLLLMGKNEVKQECSIIISPFLKVILTWHWKSIET